MMEVMSPKRSEVLGLLRKASQYQYPLRWLDGQSNRGDFDGREFAIDIFNVLPQNQREFLRAIREVRPRLEELLGFDCIFLFHSPEDTSANYTHIKELIENGGTHLSEDLDPIGSRTFNHVAFHEAT
jgi:hypothetical protein